MFKRILFFMLLGVFLQFACGTGTAAQMSRSCLATSTWWFTDQIPPGWFYFSAYPGAFVFVIAAYEGYCPPAAAKSETCPTCPSSGSPISLATGNTFIDETDVSIPGLGGGLFLKRRWNSLWPATQIASSVGIFGPNWRSTYEEKVFMGSDNYLKYARGDGSYWSFGLGPTGALVVAAPANVAATLWQSSTAWVLAFQSGEQRQFSLTTGLLTAIVDRNGNTTQLTYDGSNRLTTVADPAGRHLYFNYANGSSLLITSVTSDFGVTLSYAYDTQNRLSQVTKPDLTTVTFTYNAQSQITQVTDSNGKVLESHTYDSSGRGLTSSQANGVSALTVTYPQ
jgi:YD repeat-containing protein